MSTNNSGSSNSVLGAIYNYFKRVVSEFFFYSNDHDDASEYDEDSDEYMNDDDDDDDDDDDSDYDDGSGSDSDGDGDASEYDEDNDEYMNDDDDSDYDEGGGSGSGSDSGSDGNGEGDGDAGGGGGGGGGGEEEIRGKNKEQMDDVLGKLMYLKQFDTVEDYSDHHYRDQGMVGNQQPTKPWTKNIQEEWRILQDNLPETIFVRAYESRMDLLRAAIIGPDGTPYHDGLFFFDIMFPSSYPNNPPMVHYHSGGLRVNPNLYECGRVCLSLLGTWSGKTNELWLPHTSTMLQVLLSIQALILNSNPFFNEPGYDSTYTGKTGEGMSKSYNEAVFILNLKTMTYSLRNPPKQFEDLVSDHFRVRARGVLTACRLYVKGAEVGSNVRQIVKGGEEVEGKSSNWFKSSLPRVVKNLIKAFVKNGSRDCDKFWKG